MDMNTQWDFPSLLFEVCGALTPHPQYTDAIANGTVTDDWAWGAFRSQLALMGHMHDDEEDIVDPITVEEGFYPVIANPDADRLLEMQFGVDPGTILGRYFPMIGLGAENVLDEIGTYTVEALDLYIPSTGVSGRRSTEGLMIGGQGDDETHLANLELNDTAMMVSVDGDSVDQAVLEEMAAALERYSSPYMEGFSPLQTAGDALLRGENNIVWEDGDEATPAWPLAASVHVDILPLITNELDSAAFLDTAGDFYWFPATFTRAERHPSHAVPWLPSVLDWSDPLPADAYRLTFTVPEWSIPAASWIAGLVAVIAGSFGVHGALMRVSQG